jgi:hypothetical protein
MQPHIRMAGILFATLMSTVALFGDGGNIANAKLTDADCVEWIRMAIRAQHPKWDLRDLTPRHTRDMAFYDSGPTYHVVEVMTADQSDSNPLGPVIIWLGLFSDGKFVRLSTSKENMIYLKRFSQKNIGSNHS